MILEMLFLLQPQLSLFIRTGGEARTPDTWFWRPVLYQLSYTRIMTGKGERRIGIHLSCSNGFIIKVQSLLPDLHRQYDHLRG